MKDKNKVIVAFLVSLGLFSVSQAKQYVSKLDTKEKSKIFSVAKLNDKNIVLCENNSDPIVPNKTT